MTDEDPLLRYMAFRQAVCDWFEENANRFVVPGIEHWPEDVENKPEAVEHYGEAAADDIIDRMEDVLATESDGAEHFDGLLESDGRSPDGYARLDGVAEVLANPRTGTLVLTGQPTAFHDCGVRGCGAVGHKIGEFDVDASLFMQDDHDGGGQEDTDG
jgi:hypothetical protein